jgi:hypothetical protein
MKSEEMKKEGMGYKIFDDMQKHKRRKYKRDINKKFDNYQEKNILIYNEKRSKKEQEIRQPVKIIIIIAMKSEIIPIINLIMLL